MRAEFFTLNIPDTPGPGAAQRCRDLTAKAVEVSGTFTGSLTIELKVKNAWVAVDTIQAGDTPTFVPIDVTAEWIRINTTNVATGTPVCVLAGANMRAD